MSKLKKLRSAKTKPELARLLNIKASTFTYYLYIMGTQSQYNKFEIPKKNGGVRVINAPTGALKTIQKSLSELLLDCLDEINRIQHPDSELAQHKAKHSKFLKIKCSNARIKQPSLSHGFERKRSIITNSMMHVGKNHVFNMDLESFFASFNFGRVRGFFIKNRNFNLDPQVATVIAKIACHNNELPQGSPCSPVIANLITHSLDIRLAKFAYNKSCTYSRYADDITFSTNRKELPKDIASIKDGNIEIGKKLLSEIERSGFKVNSKKTRDQYKDSRQDVTGLVVNKKPNVKKEYWRAVRAQCDCLFKTGSFTDYDGEAVVVGNVNKLEGKLSFIDQVDHYNRLRQHPSLNPEYHLKKEALQQKKLAKLRRHLHTGREDTYSKFIFYRLFYANDMPTILTEGKTDNVYMKSAIHMLARSFPTLASLKTESTSYKLLLKFVEYNARTRFLLELSGGADYLKTFVMHYKQHYKYYHAPKSVYPVIIFVDNDAGPKDLIAYINSVKGRAIFPTSKHEVRESEFVHVFHNLYLVLTPKTNGVDETDIEYFFKDIDRLRKYKGKFFNTVSERNPEDDLSKDSFARHIIHANKKDIDFSGFNEMLTRIVKVIEHYNSIK